MKEFIQIVNTTIVNLREICHSLIIWENQDIFKKMEAIVSQIHQVITIILTNKNALEAYGFNIDEDKIIKILENMLTSMENKDTVLLLDTIECEMMPLLVEIESKLKI